MSDQALRLETRARLCDSAINLLLDDTGPLWDLPVDLRNAIRGDLDSAIQTLQAAQDRAENALIRLEEITELKGLR